MKKRPFKFALSAMVRQERVLHEGDTSAEDIAAINEHTLSPITAEDVAVFRMDLCNDQIDRHISRFPIEELQRISEDLIVGKPLMELHDMPSHGLFGSNRGSQPVGKFFRSQVVKENGTVSVRPDVFLLRGHGDDDLIAKIDAGIAAGTSISFELDRPECSSCGCDIRDCAHMPGEDVDGELCHVILREVTDVFEGSIVPLGSQSTEFVQARGADGAGEPVLPLRDAIKQARGGNTTHGIVMSGGDLAFKTDITTNGNSRVVGIGNPVLVGTHPGDETDDEIRTAIEEDLERVRAIPSAIYKD